MTKMVRREQPCCKEIKKRVREALNYWLKNETGLKEKIFEELGEEEE